MAIGYEVVRVETRTKPRSRKPRIYFQKQEESLFARRETFQLHGHASYYNGLAHKAINLLGLDVPNRLRWRTDLEAEMGPGYVVSSEWEFDILVIYRAIEAREASASLLG